MLALRVGIHAEGDRSVPEESSTTDDSESAEGLSEDLAKQLGEMLETDWPERPEWAEMMTALLKGDPMRRGMGWFKPSQSRYNWEWLAARFDADDDAKIRLEEFPPDLLDRKLVFERLDRNRDEEISAADLDWAKGGTEKNEDRLAGRLFSRLDQDSNGRVTDQEISEFFSAADREARGFLTQEDLHWALNPPKPKGGGAESAQRPTPAEWLNRLLTDQLGFLTPGPELGASAPPFELRTYDDEASVALSDVVGERPVVLNFGSFT